jgi:hypothetical protein
VADAAERSAAVATAHRRAVAADALPQAC